MKILFTNLRLVIVLFIMCSVLYTSAILGIGTLLFSHKSHGSLIARNGKVIGSELIGQAFSSPWYFHGRPSAVGYNAASSGGSNFAVTNPKLYIRMADTVASASRLDNLTTGTIAFDRVTASGSGLDPDITPENVEQQIPRIASKRKATRSVVKQLITQHTEPPFLGFLGPRKINVLALNLALDQEFPLER